MTRILDALFPSRVTKRHTTYTNAIQEHWMEPFGINSLVCHCQGWQYDGYGDAPEILIFDPIVQHSWLLHVAEALAEAE